MENPLMAGKAAEGSTRSSSVTLDRQKGRAGAATSDGTTRFPLNSGQDNPVKPRPGLVSGSVRLLKSALGHYGYPRATTKPPSCDFHATSKPGRRYFGFLAAEGPSLVCGRWRVVTMCGGERTEPRAGGPCPGLLSQQIVWSALQLGPGACYCEDPGRRRPLARPH